MELVVVDIGNTSISCGLFRGGQLDAAWRWPTADPAEASRTIAERFPLAKIAISSVVPAAAAAVAQRLRADGRSVFEIDIQKQNVISNVYDTLGADRVVNAAAALRLHGKGRSVLVFDLGTATTLTAVAADGRFAGGLITLGIDRTLDSLQKLAQLPVVEFAEGTLIDGGLAFDTRSAMAAGTLNAHIGLLKRWLEMGKDALPSGCVSVLTGGRSMLVSSLTSMFDVVDPQLTLKGIYLLAEPAADRADQG